MKFVFYNSLSSGAKKAFKRGTGEYRKYIIDGQYIGIKDQHGKVKEFSIVIKVCGKSGKSIKGKNNA